VRGGGPNSQTSSVSILVFRLEPLDGTRPVNVEMRGSRINGTVVDGEVVDVFGKPRRNGTIRAKRIVSRETGTTVDTKLPPVLLAFATIVALAILGVFVFVGISFFRDDTSSVRPGGTVPGTTRPTGTRPGGDPGSDFERQLQEQRRQDLQKCLAENTFSDDQCRHVYG
jgi:hypothetical protein